MKFRTTTLLLSDGFFFRLSINWIITILLFFLRCRAEIQEMLLSMKEIKVLNINLYMCIYLLNQLLHSFNRIIFYMKLTFITE